MQAVFQAPSSDRIARMERLRAGDPEQIGPWQIVNRLGAGGMVIVYMGTNGTRAAAIKIEGYRSQFSASIWLV